MTEIPSELNALASIFGQKGEDSHFWFEVDFENQRLVFDGWTEYRQNPPADVRVLINKLRYYADILEDILEAEE